MIDRNHPAVKAMIGRRLHVGDASDMAADRLTAALPYLASADLRDTPAGQALIREGIAAALVRPSKMPDPLPCGCENPFNAIHLLDH